MKKEDGQEGSTVHPEDVEDEVKMQVNKLPIRDFCPVCEERINEEKCPMCGSNDFNEGFCADKEHICSECEDKIEEDEYGSKYYGDGDVELTPMARHGGDFEGGKWYICTKCGGFVAPSYDISTICVCCQERVSEFICVDGKHCCVPCVSEEED